MGITEEQLSILMRDLNAARVSKRNQSGRELSYLEAWDIRATLIRVFGFGNFSAEAKDVRIVDVDKREDGKISVTAMASMTLKIHQTNSIYTETAAASQTGKVLGEVADFAIKTAVSDALKRCAINLGTQFGLSLYRDGSTREVIGSIFAPDQKWPNGQAAIGTVPKVAKTVEDAQRMLQESLGAKEVTE